MGEIENVEYRMEWVDHLDAMYGSFIKRNDPEEWFYSCGDRSLRSGKRR